MNLTIGQKIKYYRLRAGLSQLNLEILLGISSGVICRLETDKVNPTKETLFSIAKVLNLSKLETSYLFGILNKVEVYELVQLKNL